MKLLLDTHIFIWTDSEPHLLSPVAHAAIADPNNEVLVSVASLWEILIKLPTGRLTLNRPLPEIISRQLANGMTFLDIAFDHVLAIEHLPLLHKDPFDRIIIAQTVVENAFLVSADKLVTQYPVPIIY